MGSGGASLAYGVNEMTYALEIADTEFLFAFPGGFAIEIVAVGSSRGELSPC